MGRPQHFDRCFTEGMRSSANFRAYAEILKTGADRPSKSRPERHHIVPREWLSLNVDGFRFGTEDPSNVTYLSVGNRLLAMVRLAVIFLEAGDSRTYAAIAGTVSRRYHLGRGEFWRNPFLDGDTVSRLAERRSRELLSRKRKHSDEYLRRCHEAYLECGRSFDRVVEETGFPGSERALLRNFRERGLPT